MIVGIIWIAAVATCIMIAVALGVVWAVSAWIIMGALSLILYLKTWNDTPPLWFWPVIVLFWPSVFTGGIIHPLR